MIRRPATHTRLLVAVGAAALVALTACDSGDGKTLTPYDPADYPSQTSPPTSVVDSIDPDGFDPDSLDPDGLDSEAIGDPVAPPRASDESASPDSFQVYAPWEQGGIVDPRHTCDGDDVAPAISWTAVPDGTTEIALALVDDSVVENGEPFVHWAVAGLDPNEVALVEGDVPPGAVQAINFSGNVGYDGPCPPPGDEHVYRLTAFALTGSPGVTDATPAVEFLDAVEKVTLDTTDLSATYRR
jgi:Raf kinase inhibitor-like YbhB/YbcL family protein